MILETPRLRLMPFTADDVDDLHRLWTDRDVRRFLWDDVVITRKQAEEVVTSSLRSFPTDGFGLWTLRLSEESPLFGFCGLRRFGDAVGVSPPPVELMYGLDPGHWGKGFATEASRAVLRFGFVDGGLDEIHGRTDPPNVASRRVLERLGMRFVRESRMGDLDVVEYLLSRADFLAAGSR